MHDVLAGVPEEPNDAQQSSPVDGQQTTPFGQVAPADRAHARLPEPVPEPEDDPEPTSGFPTVPSTPPSAGATEKSVVPQWTSVIPRQSPATIDTPTKRSLMAFHPPTPPGSALA